LTYWVCGEALIDIFGASDKRQEVVGGGPANTARALALLGNEVEFIGGISSDMYGREIKNVLVESGVGIRHSLMDEAPTCTAEVSFDSTGNASYIFTIDGTATFEFDSIWLPDPARFKPSLLHIGSLATLVMPGASKLFEWAKHVSEYAPIVFDPNVRPLVVSDRDVYRSRIEPWLEISSVVKLSEDDLGWLYPDRTPVEVGQDWVASGLPLVIITHGSDGITAITSQESIHVGAERVEVVDAIGAGDTVGAIVSQALLTTGIVNLHGDQLEQMLRCASVAAAITCSRAGAQPPTTSELRAALGKSE
jgi:fructokinase